MNTAEYLLIPTIAASLLVLAGCTAQTATNTNKVVNTNTANDNANVEVATNTNDSNVNSDVDTSDWLTFRDDDLEIQFLHPNNYEVIDQEITDFSDSSKYDQDNFSGKSKRLVIQSKEDSAKQIILVANTKDRKSIYDIAFTGGDLSSYCHNPGQVTLGILYCDIVEIDKKEFIYRNEFVNMECSPRFNTSIAMNNPNINSNFIGLEFGMALPDIQKDLLSEPFKDNDPCAGNVNVDNKLKNYLQTDFSGNDFSTSDKSLFEVMKGVVRSVQSF